MRVIRIHYQFKLVIILWLCSFLCAVESLHLKGTWNTGQFLKFLAKFGFQRTNMHEMTATQGYIYGNITSQDNVHEEFTLVVVDSEYFIEFFANSTRLPRSEACVSMFSKIDTIAWDEKCRQTGSEDFLRRIPCPSHGLCADEDNPSMVIPGYQLTYRVQDTNQPRFWYVSMVACRRNASTCRWLSDNDQKNLLIDYDIWLVNGDPNQKTFNPFEHQFSFEMHDIVEIYLTVFVLYSILTPIQFYAYTKKKYLLPIFLLAVILLELCGVACNCIHYMTFSFDGRGVRALSLLGDVMALIGGVTFMVLLLLIAKGWFITVRQPTKSGQRWMLWFWCAFTALQLSLFVWKQTDSDVISAEDSWQTLPGCLMLLLTSSVVVGFLHALKTTFAMEDNYTKMSFYLHFGAGYLCWFVYMPVLALVCSQVSALWRYKTLLSVSYGFDFLAVCCMVHILWPNAAHAYTVFSYSVTSVASIGVGGLGDLGAELEGKRLLSAEAESDGDIDSPEHQPDPLKVLHDVSDK